MDTNREKQVRMNWENRIDNIYTIDTMYKIDNYREPTFWHREFSSMLCCDLEGNLKKIKGGYMYRYS